MEAEKQLGLDPPKPPKKRKKKATKKKLKFTETSHYFKAVPLVNITASHPDWIDLENGGKIERMSECDGALVKLQAPHDMEPEQVDLMEAACRRGGAIEVKRVPPEPRGAIVVEGEPAKGWEDRSRRELVVSMAGARENEALEALCNEVMDEEQM